MVLCSLIFVMTVVGMLSWWMNLTKQDAALKAQVTEMEANAARVTAMEGQVASEKGSISSIKAKTDYIEAVLNYDVQAVKLYEDLARFTYSRIVYKSVTPSSGSQLAIQAHARTLGDCGRYLLNMYRATDLFSSVTITGVPGWDANGPHAEGFDFAVTCALVKPITAPAYTPGSSAPAAAGPPAAGAAPPRVPGAAGAPH